MNSESIAKAISTAGIAAFLMIATANAATINYNTNAAGTKFVSSNSLVLNDSAGVAASLTFTPNASGSTGVPSNVNFGDFLLSCPTCSTLANGSGSFFNAFTFNLVITDVTDGATGMFVGTSTGGAVYSDLSGLTINWSPLQLGPNGSNALTGSFLNTLFTTSSFTGLAAPNSGTPVGDTTIQGFVGSVAAPEPATLSMVGGALLLVALIRKKVVVRRS